MKGLVATTAVLGVLAIGGLPALALTLAAEETGPAEEPTTTLVEDTGRPGPPPWAQGENREPNPGWARNHGGATPHGWAVREWAHCLADGSGDLEPGERVDPETECGAKPMSPGKAKKLSAVTESPGQQGRDKAPGKTEKPKKSKQPKAGRSG